MRVTSLSEALAALERPWEPRDVVSVNDAIVRVARLDGEFPWHTHDEDELFLCWDGEFTVETDDGSYDLKPGDLFVVPRGVRHRPVAHTTAHALLLERPETKQYGNVS